jgi:hypothetical protein
MVLLLGIGDAEGTDTSSIPVGTGSTVTWMPPHEQAAKMKVRDLGHEVFGGAGVSPYA